MGPTLPGDCSGRYSAFVHRPRDLYALLCDATFVPMQTTQVKGDELCQPRELGFQNKDVSFCTFLPHSPLQGRGTISTISQQHDGSQALLPGLLIKQNEADCCR